MMAHGRRKRRATAAAAIPAILLLSTLHEGVVSAFAPPPPSTRLGRAPAAVGLGSPMRMSSSEDISERQKAGGAPPFPPTASMPELSLDKNGIQSDFVSSGDTVAVVAALYEQEAEAEYRRGLLTVGFITLIFASMSPAFKIALEGGGSLSQPPVLLLNAAVGVVALSGLSFGGPLLEATTPLPRSLLRNQEREAMAKETDGALLEEESSGPTYLGGLSPTVRAGLELGLWKFLGTTANLYGLSLTTADHGAFLIQLTTLIVPSVQGIMGVPIPRRIVASIGLALAGVFLFTQDTTGTCGAGAVKDTIESVRTGDALCVVAAAFYATYDLRLFKWGKLVTPRGLITGKIATQAGLSLALLLAAGRDEAAQFVSGLEWPDAAPLLCVVLWSGLAVNAVAPFLQVGGQQAVGPSRAQTLYASQPLWAAGMSYAFLGETVGTMGLVGGAAFLGALFLAATAEPPDPDCGVPTCEV